MPKWISTLWRDDQGQDLIEYALLAAALFTVTSVLMPDTVVPAISTMFSRVESALYPASQTGS